MDAGGSGGSVRRAGAVPTAGLELRAGARRVVWIWSTVAAGNGGHKGCRVLKAFGGRSRTRSWIEEIESEQAMAPFCLPEASPLLPLAAAGRRLEAAALATGVGTAAL